MVNITGSAHIFVIFTSRVSGRGNIFGSVRLCVCVGLLRVHTPLQRYMGYLCTRKAQYAPPRRNMHHGAQGRLCFLKKGAPWCTIRPQYAPPSRNVHHGAQGRHHIQHCILAGLVTSYMKLSKSNRRLALTNTADWKFVHSLLFCTRILFLIGFIAALWQIASRLRSS